MRLHVAASSLAALLFVSAPAVFSSAWAASPPPLEAYGQLPAVDQVALSPDGSHVAMVMRKGAEQMLVDYDVQSGQPKARPLGKVKLRDLIWADNQHIVIETSATTGIDGLTYLPRELYTAASINTVTGKAWQLYVNWSEYFPVVITDIDAISKDGKGYIVAGGLTQDGYLSNLNRFDPETGQVTKLDQGENYTNSWAYGPDGKPVGRDYYRQDTHLWKLQMNVSGNWKDVLSQEEKIDTPALVGLGRDPNSVIVYFNAGDRKDHYYELSSQGSLIDLKADTQERVGIMHNPKTRLLAGFSYSDDWTDYDYFDPDLKALPGLVRKAFPDYRVLISAIARDNSKKIVAYSEGADDSGTYTYIDFATGQTQQLGLAYPNIPPEWVTEKTAIDYKAADGTPIHAYLTLPPGKDAKNLPLIVLPHGGPQARDDLGFDATVSALASRGYAVLQPNFRGSSGYGAGFVAAGYGEWGGKMQTDLSDGVRYLAARGTIDAKRVCIVGASSYGGYAALAGAAIDTGVYRCAVSFAGISDLNTMLINEGQHVASRDNSAIYYWKRFFGPESRWDSVSPLKHIANVTIPVLLIHGKDDTVVTYQQSKQMADALKAAGKPVEFVTLAGEDHWLSTNETRLQMLKATVDFLLRNNPPD
ncbi:MAG TPA: prolyl oligopeptidase family serine peptidase [Asticcacaulis sp.]|nr:prolyl oligopeptidase family serine peptidase [Asticcacaulis sp.]